MLKSAKPGRKPTVAQPSLTEPQRLWVEALRSGKYKWGKGQLRQDDKFCCLGVACELAVEAGIINWYAGGDGTLAGYWPVLKWLDLAAPNGAFDIEPDGQDDTLADVNDHATRNPFRRIARLIESKPDGLFG